MVSCFHWCFLTVSHFELEFEKAAIWVRIFNLPLACMGRDFGHRLGSSVGRVEEVDVAEDGMGWGKFLSVRIVLDLSKPLFRGRTLKLNNKSIWVAFQYEKIPKFCFQCGGVWHWRSGCSNPGGTRDTMVTLLQLNMGRGCVFLLLNEGIVVEVAMIKIDRGSPHMQTQVKIHGGGMG